MFTTLSYADILGQERTRLREKNDCHTPAGSPAGGQFCSKGGPSHADAGAKAASLGLQRPGAAPATPTGRAALSPAGKAAVDRFHTLGIFRSPEADNPYEQPTLPGIPAGGGIKSTQATAATVAATGVVAKRSPHKVVYHDPGTTAQDHIATYRDMQIYWQRPYISSYYVNAPGFGSFHSARSIPAIRRQIDRFRDTGETVSRFEKRKASERYQKRKARYGRG